MALGYEVGTIMKRTSECYSDDELTIKIDDIEGMGCKFVQVNLSGPATLCMQPSSRQQNERTTKA